MTVSIRGLWIWITVAAAFIGPASSPIALPDIFWSLQRGAWMVAHGALLDFDPFTSAPHLPGPVLNVQWLADLTFYGLYALDGLAMVICGTAVLVATTYTLLLATCLTASGHVRLSCIAVWIAYLLGASNLSPRPQTLAYPLFGLFLLAVARAEWRQDRRLLWLLPAASVIWANVHGSFFTGLLLLGCAAAGRALAARSLSAARPYLLVLGACGLACMVTPYGPGSLVYLAAIGGNQVIRDYVTEWAPTNVTWHEGTFFFISLVLVAGLLFRSRVRLTLLETLILLVFGWLGLSSVRGIVWWGLASAPVVARLLGGAVSHRPPAGRDRPALNVLIAAAVLVVAALSLPWNKQALPILPADKRGLLTPDAPVLLGEYLRSHDPPAIGHMFNSQAIGGYLDWAAWPRHQPFLDGRIELHPTEVWLDYLTLVFPGAGWRSLLDKYDISYVVLYRPHEADLIAEMRSDAQWRVTYEDDLTVVLVRSAASAP